MALENNPYYAEHMLALDRFGIKSSRNLFSFVSNSDPIEVGVAIAYMVCLKRRVEIPEPEAYFRKAVTEQWAAKNAIAILNNPELVQERRALFELWLSCTTKLGHWNTYTDGFDGTRIVSINGKSQEPFVEAWKRGWNLLYLSRQIHPTEIYKIKSKSELLI